jgi:hypothetical protein
MFFGWKSYMWIGSLAVLGVILLVYPRLPKQVSPNHRVPMIGSRFSPLRDKPASPAAE